MRWSVALYFGAALAAGSIGCRSTSPVESQLRARESDVQHLKGELDRSDFHNGLLVRELAAMRGVPGPLGVVERPSEPYPVRSLRLGRGTRGRPSEHLPGDDALEVMIEPIDCDAQVLKAPGAVHIEVQEVSREGLKSPLSSWDIGPKDLRHTWQSGLFNTGYKLTLPWKVFPNTEKLRVIAHFRMIDGRIFEADRDITVRVVPEKFRPTPALPVLPAPTPLPPTPSTMTPIDPIPMPAGPVPMPPADDKSILPDPTPADGPDLTGAVKLLRPIATPKKAL